MGIVTSLTNGLSEREANDALNAHVSVISFRDKKSCLDGRIRGPLYPRGSLSEGAGVQAGSKAQRPGRYEEAGERSPLCARCSQPIEDSRSYYSEKTKQPRGFNPGLIPFLEADPQCGFLLKSGWVRSRRVRAVHRSTRAGVWHRASAAGVCVSPVFLYSCAAQISFFLASKQPEHWKGQVQPFY